MTPQALRSYMLEQRQRSLLRMALLSLFLVLVLTLAACGGGNNTTTSTKAYHILTVAVSPKGNFSQNFNPFLAPGNVNLYGTNGMIYETLYFFNREDGSSTPMLATGYQFSKDANSVTITLRQGVKWSDGQPFTSDDVVYTLNLMQKYKALDTAGLWNTIKNVSAPDANTVVVNFIHPAQPVIWYLAGQTYIVPKHVWQSVSDPTQYTNNNPVGTGPFVLKSFTPEIYKLAKNPNYWQPGRPAVDELDYPAFDSNTSTELLLSRGTLDWNGQFTPNIQKTYVDRDPAHNHYWFPPHQVTALYMNLAKFPFNNLAVRQAISYAIDRDQLNKLGESGYQAPASPTGLVLPANKSFLSPAYANSTFTVDTSKATSLLQSAGFTKGGDGIYADKNGKKLAFTINVVTGWTDWVTDCQIMQSELKAIGINVNVNAVSFNAYFTALQMGTYDSAIHWTNPGPTPYYLYNTLLNSANTAPVGKQAASNWSRWSDSNTDKLLNQYASSTDSSVQQQAINGLQKIMVEQLPVIPLVYGSTWYEYSTARFTGWPDQNNAYAVPGPFETPDAEIVVLHLQPV